MLLEGSSDQFRVGDAGDSGSSETVRMDTLDNVCRELSVGHISFLKIDTEGHDLDVLRGGRELLREHRVDVIETEVGMGPDNERHVPYGEIVSYLEGLQYRVFGLYEQVPEWPTGQPHLRRSNAVLISSRLIAAANATPT